MVAISLHLLETKIFLLHEVIDYIVVFIFAIAIIITADKITDNALLYNSITNEANGDKEAIIY